MSVRLGELLVRSGFISPHDLKTALNNQLILGGRLGTNLVRIGAISEDKLALSLSKALRVPCVARERLQGISDEVLGLVPREVAARYAVVPFARHGRQLHLAAVEVRDLAALDELAFITSHIVRPFIAPELLLARALKRYYQICGQGRFIDLDKASSPRPEDGQSPPLRLGEFLVRQGLLTGAQLQQALGCQAIFGLRLGSHLVEQGLLSEERLVTELGRFLRLPAIDRRRLMAVTPEVLALVPKAVAQKYRLVPVELQQRQLSVATTAATDLQALDEVAFATGFIIRPLVAPEVLLAEALQKHYQIPRRASAVRLSGGGDELLPAGGKAQLQETTEDLLASWIGGVSP